MNCPRCGTASQPGETFCNNCGYNLSAASTPPSESGGYVQPPAPTLPPVQTPPPPKKNRTLLIVIIVILVILACCCLAMAAVWVWSTMQYQATPMPVPALRTPTRIPGIKG